MITIPAGPSLIIHGLVVFASRFFPSLLIRYKKISAGYFGFIFLILYLVFIVLFVAVMFYYLLTGPNNMQYVYKMIAPDAPVPTQVMVTTASITSIEQIEPIDYIEDNRLIGATNAPTGLTNSPLTDSFFIPLVFLVIGAWLFKRWRAIDIY